MAVYIFRGKGGGDTKIGKSDYWEQRLEQVPKELLQNPIPVEICGHLQCLGVRSGGHFEEKWYHRKYQQYRKHGEWFSLPEDVLQRSLLEFSAPSSLVAIRYGSCGDYRIVSDKERHIPIETKSLWRDGDWFKNHFQNYTKSQK